LRPKEGPECPIDDSAAPIRDADGRIIGVVLVFHDVTARREAARAERQTHAKLMEKVIELEQFERAVVGRELRMVELEKENAAIKKELERLKARRET
jgi:transcriptional regulator of acetoin/glycerol metabolism